MNLFIKKTFLLITSFLLILYILLLITNSVLNKNAIFKIDKNCKYIVLGHSHPECAFNDSLINNFSNLSQSGESYFYTYQKVKKIIIQNPQIEVIFIEFTNNQIDEKMNQWIWGDQFLAYRYPIYSSLMSIEDFILLLRKNPNTLFNAISVSAKKNTERVFKNEYNFIDEVGGYLYLKRDKTDSIVNTLQTKSNVLKNTNTNPSKYNIKYLRKIIDLCKKNKKQVYLIRSPQHKMYSRTNETVYKKIIETDFKDIEYLDLNHFPLNNSEFGDLGHLNYKGARIFSIWFNSLMKDSLLNKQEKQIFVNDKIIEFGNLE